jgi:hypothetical protein
MRAYCTIFDSIYLIRGLALFESLVRHTGTFRLYVFAMDELAVAVLRTLNDQRLIVVTPEDFESPELLAVKNTRTIAEYYWTCTPSIVHYCLAARNEPECTYVDADVWLMSDPEPLFTEMRGASVLLTEHRYTPRHDQSELSGKYCVQFMRFRGSSEGLAALNWWRTRCLEWCFARREDGRFGDQKYLDDWPVRFAGVHVLKYLGGGIAPWNVGRYVFRKTATGVEVSEDGQAWHSVVFHHFHGMRSYSKNLLCFAYGYSLDRNVKALIYAPYARELARIFTHVQPHLHGIAAHGLAPSASNDGSWLRRLVRRTYGIKNTYSLDKLPSNVYDN